MNLRVVSICILIFLFRLIDLYTTEIGIENFQQQEQNLIVKLTGMNMKTFFVMEVVFALLFVACYLIYVRNKSLFFIKATSFNQYFNLFFLNKIASEIKDWILYFDLKRVLVLFGSIIPVYVITTSILFSLNNYWVILYTKNNQMAVKYYLLFNDYYFFDFIIFVFPVTFLFFLLIQKINKEFEKHKTHVMIKI